MDISKETCITGGWQYLEMSKTGPIYVAIILRRLTELGMSEAELARTAKLEPSYLSNMLRGKLVTPNIEKAIRIARALRMDLHSLFEGKKDISLEVTLTGAASGEGAMWQTSDGGRTATVPIDLFGEDVVKIVIEGRTFEPVYSPGDVVMGSKATGAYLHNLIGQDCIVKSANDERMIVHLVKAASRGKFTVRPVGSREKSPTTDVQIEWAAPIKLVLKKAI